MTPVYTRNIVVQIDGNCPKPVPKLQLTHIAIISALCVPNVIVEASSTKRYTIDNMYIHTPSVYAKTLIIALM